MPGEQRWGVVCLASGVSGISSSKPIKSVLADCSTSAVLIPLLNRKVG